MDAVASLDGATALMRAARWGHGEVVRRLLADPRVDPAADANQAIKYAAAYCYAGVAALLLADPRVDPEALAGAEFVHFRGRPPVAAALAKRRRC